MVPPQDKITELKNILKRLKESKRIWKTELVVFWDYAFKFLKPKYVDKGFGNKKITYTLPAFHNSNAKIKAKDMYKFCTTRDDYLSYSRLVHISSLFEDFTRTAGKPKKISTAEWLEKQKITPENIEEIMLARKTRNCYVHNNGNADLFWLKAYRNARKHEPPIKEGEAVRNAFPGKKNKHGQVMNRLLENIQKWHNLIIKCSKQILMKK